VADSFRKMSRALQRWILLVVLSAVGLYYVLYLRSEDASLSGLFSSDPTAHHIDWAKIRPKYPVAEYAQLPKDPSKTLPKVQAPFAPESEEERTIRVKRQQAVKDVFLRSWSAYKDNAWGHDEFAPITKAFKDHFGGWGATLVDTLDTLLIMGLEEEFQYALKTVETIDFSVTHMKTVNVFEMTIRYLGGLLGAHDLAKGKDNGLLLKKAKELSEMIYHAFDTPNRMPVTRWTWHK
jgi:mannosyl-oligosaccharide alpha-1,2-mannosidase